uniref:Small-subunit processome Utp12 domain-containing protein n=1 Tax=Acrobeloides nanus TaxID=290746 RepID=A0A914DMK3_9BILA
MNINFRLTHVVGSVYKNGNVEFFPNGTDIICPIGNKLNIFNLKENFSSTLSVESPFNIRVLAVNNTGTHAFIVNEVGSGFYVNLLSQVILHRIKFGHDVRSLKFSPSGKRIAVCTGGKVEIYSTSYVKAGQFNPLVQQVIRELSTEPIRTVVWAEDEKMLVCGGSDNEVRVLSSDRQFANISVYTLSHKAPIIGCYFFGNGYDFFSVDQRGVGNNWESNLKPDELVLKTGDKEIDEKATKMTYAKTKRAFLLEHAGSGLSANITATAFHKENMLLVVAFSNGVFIIYEMPEYNLIQNLRVSEMQISTLAINSTGDWLAIGCGQGSSAQLVVWEWQSETYIMKQQSHSQAITSVAYSPDGALLATGAEDGKVKIWNCQTCFCVVTFTEHQAGVTGVCWTQSGKVVLSASLEGTVRAHDLKRYRNFRTMVCPKQTQLGCLCVDSSGELVMASSRDDFQIYIWSMDTGNLLDVLAGHSSMVSKISCFHSTLASVSLDKTLRIWNVVEATGSEAIQLIHEGLDIKFSPSGDILAALCYDSNITLFDSKISSEIGTIDGKLDLDPGRQSTEIIKKKTSEKSKSFTCITFSPDGLFLLAGGQSNLFCLYSVSDRIILRKFKITRNMSLDGVMLDIDYRKLSEFGSLDLIDASDSEDEDRLKKKIKLAGTAHSDIGERSAMPVVKINALDFNPTGRSFAIVSTEGVAIYSVDTHRRFDPFQLGIEVTPENIERFLEKHDFTKALSLALRLNQSDLVQTVLEDIPVDRIKLVVNALGLTYAEKLLKWLADETPRISTRHIHFYQLWVRSLIFTYGHEFKSALQTNLSSLTAIQQMLSNQSTMLAKLCDQNAYTLEYLIMARKMKMVDMKEEEDGDENMES